MFFDWLIKCLVFSTTKVRLVKAMVSPVVMYGCESWTIKEAESRRIDDFEPWCWRRLLRVPWTARRSNQSILKEISPECSLEGRMLQTQLSNWTELNQSGLKGSLGGSDGKESTCNAEDVGDMGSIPASGRSPGVGHGNPLQYSCLENPMDRGAWQATVHGVAKSRTWLSDFTSLQHIDM